MSDNGDGDTGAALIWCPFPDPASANEIVGHLLDERLIACANILPGVISHFVWDGQRETAQEVGVLLKTNALRLNQAVTRLAELHPYEEPAVMGWRCDAVPPGTLAWLGALGG